jgi:sigma-B regulation protein RsbU (phosphoserine phosphatase)
VTAANAALLIVDDNEDNRYTLSRRLARYGYDRLTMASNGREALQLLEAQPFDLVLLDIMMPEMNGYEVLERIMASPELRQIPVIMISAVDEMDSVIRCIELGAEDYLSKPFNPTLLRARIGASLEKKSLRDELRASAARLQCELDAARELQLGMLPRVFPEISPGRPVEIYAAMEPAREVGGDLYDFFYAGDDLFCFLIGDVSGKGAPAAMFMARTRSLVRMAVQCWEFQTAPLSPAVLAGMVNRELCQNNSERMFVALFLGLLNTRSGILAYINAGHPPAYLLRTNGTIEGSEGRPERPLGVHTDTIYHDQHARLVPGDGLFLSTDGAIEATNENEELYTAERLDGDVCGLCAASPKTIVGVVKERVDLFSGAAPKADDVTMLALRWHEPAR